MSRWNRTHAALQQSALRLFQDQGYDATGTAQIAADAGVSEVTLFRHFPTKASLLLDDPFDPRIAAAVRDRPRSEAALTAVVEAVRATWQTLDPDTVEQLRTRLRLVASTPSLRAAARGDDTPTIDALTSALRARDVEDAEARVVATAVVAGLGAALLAWSRTEASSLDAAVGRALDAMGGR
ncbi:TetR/AcrR family transcriptional regulator [Cellulomonas sp. B6]|uniref:TetR/AcrR family transcriptional regulator n=1 Tax=Cellulomonas sp. B6 TaxID=1295626 RepID=UPI001681AC62|nr:TetR/AcrR family transcriptional regulator [Cellulomonas sp. B6]